MKKFIGLVIACSLALGFFTQQVFAATKLIKIDGSSTVFPITEAVAEEFQKQHSGIKVMVGISGTGGGFKRFGRGEIDISDASRPIKPKEVELCKENNIGYIELPVAYDGLAVVVNPKNTWVDYLTVKELKKLWEPSSQRVITKWSQIREGFPDKEIRLYGAGTDSGTFDYFTEAICGKTGASRGDYTASEDDNALVEGVASDTHALGYFGLAYYEQNKDKLKIVPIDDGNDANGKGPIEPTSQSVTDATYQPLARPIFIYISTQAAKKEEVQKFVEFYLKNAPELVAEVGYIPLPKEAYAAALERFNKRITGSVFGGKGAKMGVKMADLLRMEK
ncbi:MAG: PstS family phosphate ABC transporter substrate-binding protein [Candidatus Omnitrophica bacterium]|nr:PstS family phosphate ABC transporter substrate-binding protein [Candidatus Omnitrophota bacterium]MCG2706937.1 PstS family phosphate ABC transporter substrate-binding protein [Candidatus Omnitrophota bacterium]